VDGAIDKVVATLAKKGVQFKDSVIRSEAGNFVHLEDPDGNEIYLWEVNPVTVPETELALSEKE
jgi:predicted enzyme related to lactoylglutathione lyase